MGVVTYIAMIDVDAPSEDVPPGGTAIVTLAGSERTDAVRIPNNALTFAPSADTFAAEFTLHRSGAVEKYRDAHWTPSIRKLADNGGFDTSGYEGFDDFYGGLKTKLSKDQVREQLRRSVRRRMEDEGKVWMSDLQTDKVLQRGLVEILDRLGK